MNGLKQHLKSFQKQKYIVFFKVCIDYIKQIVFTIVNSCFNIYINGPVSLAYGDLCHLPGYTCWLLRQTKDKLQETYLKTPVTHNISYGL